MRLYAPLTSGASPFFRETRGGVHPISGENNGAMAIAFGGPRSSRRALRTAPELPQ